MPDSEQVISPASPSDNDPEYIIDNIMPAHEIHLLGGPSGAGKTTLAMQTLYELKHGNKIYGHVSHWVPTCYIACDRSLHSIQCTLKRMKIELDIPIVSLIDDNIPFTIEAVVSAALRKVPNCRLIVIDAIGSLVPDGKLSDYRKVQAMLADATRLCQRRRLTMWGLGHTAKVREGEQFRNPRERFLGSVAWGGFSDTMICIEPTNPEDPSDPRRKVMVLPRNSPCMVFEYGFNNAGSLVPANEVDLELTLDVNLIRLEPNTELLTSTILSWADGMISKRSVERWLSEAVSSGRLERTGKGHYKKPNVQ